MRISRLYTPQIFIQGGELAITGQTAHHVAHVLRLRSGASVHVFDGRGCEHRAFIKTIKRSEIILKIAEAITVRPEPSLDITLLQGITRNDRMDFILQKTVELGVKTIQPLWTQHSQKHLKGSRLDKRLKHWQGVIISACEQCGRATIPQLAAARNYSDWMSNQETSGLRLLLQPDSETGLGTLKPPYEKIHVLIGPEGGLDADEQILAKSTGFLGICLGPRILRTETAAMAALAGIQTLWGDCS
ncbi:MAG: 16S rRNA (uracil(1498)-N(3))-methyltransferase [Pseudomonadota bacterium]